MPFTAGWSQRRSSSRDGESSASSSSDSIVLAPSPPPSVCMRSPNFYVGRLNRPHPSTPNTTASSTNTTITTSSSHSDPQFIHPSMQTTATTTTTTPTTNNNILRHSPGDPTHPPASTTRDDSDTSSPTRHTTSGRHHHRRLERTFPEPLSSRMCPYKEEMHYAPYIDVHNITSKELSESEDLYSRDFAELSFNIRVLSVALDPETPLLERYKFCCIVSANLDEHFVKRLGPIERADPHDYRTSKLRLQRHVRPRTDHEDKLDRAIRAVVADQHRCLTKEILPRLQEYGLRILTFQELSPDERTRVDHHFRKYIQPALTPLVIDVTHPFPRLASHVMYICADVCNPSTFPALAEPEHEMVVAHTANGPITNPKLAFTASTSAAHTTVWQVFFKIPSSPRRMIPTDDSGLRFLPVERLVEAKLHLLCRGMQVVRTNVFRVTRNIKMSLEDTDLVDGMDLMETVQRENHRRRSAPPFRLEVPAGFPDLLRHFLVRELGLDDADVFVIDCPILDLSSAMDIAFAPLPQLKIIQKEPQVPRRFRGVGDTLATDPGAIFRIIRDDDVLIEHPRDSFEASTLLFLAAAARDPKVRSIKQVVYRTGGNSPLIEALVRAAKNGKEVTVLVELKASFDEVQNCEYANRLQRTGCNVMYGLWGLKVHSKIILVVREEEDGTLRSYANISTGNYNPKTAKLYTDVALLTCNEDLCADMHDIFNALSGFSLVTEFRAALVAPVNMVDKFIELIRGEAESARAGRPSRIVCQVNGLSDVTIIKELYDASQAGVPIDLFVRGACRLRPGLPGLSDNIRVFSWIGPVLQHRRIYYYYANGEEKYFIGSADWRTRNLNERTEVVIPISADRIKKRLSKILTAMNDCRHLWQLQLDGRYYKGSAMPEDLKIAISPVVPDSGPVRPNARDHSRPETVPAMGSEPEAFSTPSLAVPSQDTVPLIGSGSREGVIGDPKTSSVSLFGLGGFGMQAPGEGVDVLAMKGKHLVRPKQYTVNIKGTENTVDKIAVGAVLIRYDDPLDIKTLRVLIIRRTVEDDPWSVPKGGIDEGESPLEAAQRVTREKAGVYSSEHVGTLGWILRKKRNKTLAISTFIFRVLELINVPSPQQARISKWVTFKEAHEVVHGSNNSFTLSALRLADQRCCEMFAERLTEAGKNGPSESYKPKDDSSVDTNGVRRTEESREPLAENTDGRAQTIDETIRHVSFNECSPAPGPIDVVRDGTENNLALSTGNVGGHEQLESIRDSVDQILSPKQANQPDGPRQSSDLNAPPCDGGEDGQELRPGDKPMHFDDDDHGAESSQPDDYSMLE